MHYPKSKNPWLAAVIFKAYTVQSNPPQRSYNNRSVSHNLCFLPQGKVADLTVSHKNKQRKFKPTVYNYSGSIFYVSNTLISTEKPPFHPMISIPHLKVFIIDLNLSMVSYHILNLSKYEVTCSFFVIFFSEIYVVTKMKRNICILLFLPIFCKIITAESILQKLGNLTQYSKVFSIIFNRYRE